MFEFTGVQYSAWWLTNLQLGVTWSCLLLHYYGLTVCLFKFGIMGRLLALDYLTG